MRKVIASEGVDIRGRLNDPHQSILTSAAVHFLAGLHRRHNPRRLELLARRQQRQQEIDQGRMPDFLPETRSVRESEWKIAPIPIDLKDRRVEITGPVDRKMVINALNSGATTYMADFEDAHSPTWEGTLDGQLNLRDAVDGTISYLSAEGKSYQLAEHTAVLLVRPRGWHLEEKHMLVNGQPISGSLFDFGLFFFHNAKKLLSKGSGPYFYLPKLESHLEARLWNDVFVDAQDQIGVPRGSIKATVLIETILAAFETEEILFELREHAAGLNCGRWDYIFSFIKRFRNREEYLFPDRSQIGMTQPCMRAYTLNVIRSCHRRGAHAMGGMAAQIPIKSDQAAHEKAIKKVREDKAREAADGHDGTWVAHPGLVAVAREEFDRVMPGPNQIGRLREDVRITNAELLALPQGNISEAGLRTNVRVGIQYLAHWLSGNGCVPLYHLMEDAATAEICRTQVWQWVHHPRGMLADGRIIDLGLVRTIIREELSQLRVELGEIGFTTVPHEEAARLFDEIIANPEFEEFLTLKAYQRLDPLPPLA